MKKWEKTPTGWRSPEGSGTPTVQEPDDEEPKSEDHSLGLRIRSTMSTYHSVNANNLQTNMFETFEQMRGMVLRLTAELDTVHQNFVALNDKLTEIEKTISSNEEETERRHKDLDDHLGKKFEGIDAIQKKADGKHEKLVKQVAELTTDFNNTAASLESKNGNLQRLIRNQTVAAFHPSERSVGPLKLNSPKK